MEEAVRPSAQLDGALRRIGVDRLAGGRVHRFDDQVAVEEPLEIQLGSATLVVLMRTPGHDAELARGFLVSEGVVAHPGQIRSLRHCSLATDPDAADNVIRVHLEEGVPVDLQRLRRNLHASSSCGICGKASIENVLHSAPPLHDDSRFDARGLAGLVSDLRSGQALFDRTGGVHGAGLVAPDGSLLVVREDVGRHNAVDKVIGWALERGRLPLSGHALVVSGRISFEIAQKALAARIPLVAAVSAPTSLAVELAEGAGLTLVGFLREGRANVYGLRARLAGEGPAGLG